MGLSEEARARLDEKRAERLERARKKSDRSSTAPTYKTGYEQNEGEIVKQGQDEYRGRRSITNAAIAVGQQVVHKGTLIDQMRKRKQEKRTTRPIPSPFLPIKYLIRLTSGATAEYWVCGHTKDSVKVFDIDTEQYQLVGYAIDNLGKDDFYLNVHLRKLDEQVDFLRLYQRSTLLEEYAVGDTLDTGFDTIYLQGSTTGFYGDGVTSGSSDSVFEWLESPTTSFFPIGYGKWIGNFLIDKNSTHSEDESDPFHWDYSQTGIFNAKIDLLTNDELDRTDYPNLSASVDFTNPEQPFAVTIKVYDYTNIPNLKDFNTSVSGRFKNEFNVENGSLEPGDIYREYKKFDYAIWYQPIRTSKNGDITITKYFENEYTYDALTGIRETLINLDHLLVIGSSETAVNYLSININAFDIKFLDIQSGSQITVVNKDTIEEGFEATDTFSVTVAFANNELEPLYSESYKAYPPSITGDIELLCASYSPN